MKNKISIWLSSIALFFALLAAGFTFFRTTPMEADWLKKEENITLTQVDIDYKKYSPPNQAKARDYS